MRFFSPLKKPQYVPFAKQFVVLQKNCSFFQAYYTWFGTCAKSMIVHDGHMALICFVNVFVNAFRVKRRIKWICTLELFPRLSTMERRHCGVLLTWWQWPVKLQKKQVLKQGWNVIIQIWPDSKNICCAYWKKTSQYIHLGGWSKWVWRKTNFTEHPFVNTIADQSAI